MSPVETGSYLAHSLTVPRRALPDELIEYVYRISAGIPKYIYLTARQLLTEQAIVIEEIGRGTRTLEHRESVLQRHEHFSGLKLTQRHIDSLRSDSIIIPPAPEIKTQPVEEEQSAETPNVIVNGIVDDTTNEVIENGRKEDFVLHGQLLTGKAGISADVTTSDDDSQHGEDIEFEKLHGGRSKYITVYKFKQQMHFETIAPIKRDLSTKRPSSASANASVYETPQPELVVDELRVSQMQKVDADTELLLADGLYVRKPREYSEKDSDDGVKHPGGSTNGSIPKTAMQSDQEAQQKLHRKAFEKGFQQKADDILRYGRAKYETPVRDLYATQPGKDDTLEEPDWESHQMQFRDRAHPTIRKPYLPPGPEVFTGRGGQLAFVPEFTSTYETSVECQTMGNKLEKQGSDAHHFGPLTKIKRESSTESKPVRVRVIKDLKRVPFVSELRAAAMSLMERLEPDEQLAAKVASVFPVAFTGFELQAVYPRPMSPESFQRMIDNLITKEMLENCEPPAEDQLQELDLIPLQSHIGTRKTPIMNVVDETQTPEQKELKTTNEDINKASTNANFTHEDSHTEVSSEESLVSEVEPIANRWGFDDDGSPIFYRFTSIAFQHVVADLLMSAERSFLARISRKVICFRRTYGLSFLMKQINAKLIDSPMDYHEDVDPDIELLQEPSSLSKKVSRKQTATNLNGILSE